MKQLTSHQIAQMIDISAVKASSTQEEVLQIATAAARHHFICVFALPGMMPLLSSLVKPLPHILLGGVVGFPSGGETTSMKLCQAGELKEAGCDEIDMVMNIGMLKSGLTDEVEKEIMTIRRAIDPLPLKVIIEVSLLTEEEICKAALAVVNAGAAFVKTGTGWAGETTLSHVHLIKKTVGNRIPIKVAGGVKDLDTLLEMYRLGVSRFGIGYQAALRIMEEAIKREEI